MISCAQNVSTLVRALPLEPLFLRVLDVCFANDNGRFYVGHTEDPEVRLEDHNRLDSFDGKFTRKNGPWGLVWSEPHPTRALAIAKERQIKAMKSSRWIVQKRQAPSSRGRFLP